LTARKRPHGGPRGGKTEIGETKPVKDYSRLWADYVNLRLLAELRKDDPHPLKGL
jgi:hypothetical protein